MECRKVSRFKLFLWHSFTADNQLVKKAEIVLQNTKKRRLSTISRWHWQIRRSTRGKIVCFCCFNNNSMICEQTHELQQQPFQQIIVSRGAIKMKTWAICIIMIKINLQSAIRFNMHVNITRHRKNGDFATKTHSFQISLDSVSHVTNNARYLFNCTHSARDSSRWTFFGHLGNSYCYSAMYRRLIKPEMDHTCALTPIKS